MGQVVIGQQLVALLVPTGDLIDAAARIFVQRNVEPVDELGILGLDEIRAVLAVVLGGLGDIIAEAAHQLQAHHVAVLAILLIQLVLFAQVLFGLLGQLAAMLLAGALQYLLNGGLGQLALVFEQGAALDFRIQIHAVLAHFQQPGHVVDARDLPLYLLVIFHVQLAQQALAADLHAVAKAHGLDAGGALHGAAQHGHGIGIVQKQGVRANLFHIPGEVQHHRDGAQGAEDAADAQGIGDGLAKAVALGHLKVDDRAGLIAAHLDGVDHIIGAAQGILALLHAQIGLDFGLAAVVAVDGLQHQFGLIQPLSVNIVQRDGGILQSRGHHTVAQHVFGKNRAASTHKGNFRHGNLLPEICMDISDVNHTQFRTFRQGMFNFLFI